MPPLETMPGAWPAQVLIATTSGRDSLPDCRRAPTLETPVDAALPRSGSGGAFFSASKSSALTAGLGGRPAASCLADRPLADGRALVVPDGVAEDPEDDDGDEELGERRELHGARSVTSSSGPGRPAARPSWPSARRAAAWPGRRRPDLAGRRDASRATSRASSCPRLASAIVFLMCSRTLSSAFTSASTDRPSSCSWILIRACADCIFASIESRSALSFRISACTLISDGLAESASLLRRLELRLQLGDVGGRAGSSSGSARRPDRPDWSRPRRSARPRSAPAPSCRLLEPLVDVLAPADDRRRRRLELRVLLDHRVDRVLVGDLRVLLLDVRDPDREEALPEVARGARTEILMSSPCW